MGYDMGHRTYARSDRGFALAALIVFLTALSIALAASAPAYQMQAQRELEQELIFRGQEYVRAIQKYQRSFGIFPLNIDALLNTNGIRYLRRLYTDPITGDGFRLLTVNPDGTINGSTMYEQFGEQQDLFQGGTPQMFGQGQSGQPFQLFGGAGGPGPPPMVASQQGRGGLTGRGGQQGGGFNPGGFTQPGTGGGRGGGFGPGGTQAGFGQAVNPNQANPGNFGQPFGGGGGFGQQNSGFGQAVAPNNQAGRGNFGQPGFGQGGGQQSRGGPGGFGGGQQGRGGPAGFGAGGGFGGSQSGMSPTTTSGAGAGGFGNTNVSAGGIVGVAPLNEDVSLIAYNQRELYNEWEFIALPGFGTVPLVSPLAGQAAQPGTGAQNPFGQSQTSPFGQGQPAPFGQSTSIGASPNQSGQR